MKLSVLDQSPVPAGSTAADALHNTIDLARFTETLGYARYWVAEHHSTPALASPAPEIMIARVAAETSRIRVGSGAVLLPHYSPYKVVETFRVLHALYPGRIDLGIGRAPGGSGLDAYALQRYRNVQPEADDFAHQLLELLAFLNKTYPPEHPFGRMHVSPDMPGGPEVWLLGSSGWSADAAAHLGLPYAAAHFINPSTTRASIDHYCANFQPSATLAEPLALIAIGAVCAETDSEAEHLYASQRLRRLLRERGESGPIPRPEDAVERLRDLGGFVVDEDGEWPRTFVGSAGKLAGQIASMARDLGVDEAMLVTVVHGHDARRRSYELLAGEFDLS